MPNPPQDPPPPRRPSSSGSDESLVRPVSPDESAGRRAPRGPRETRVDATVRDYTHLPIRQAAVPAMSELATSLTGSASDLARCPLPEQGESLGGMRILGEIARGGMGVVYRVVPEATPGAPELALKLVNDVALDAEGRARFRKELEALGRASGHPNVVRVHATGQDRGGRPYYVMELVRGRSLEDAIRERGALAPEEAARIVGALGRALEHVHARGIIHRDLKPANILLREQDGSPVLTDFGLSAVQGADQARLTHTREVLGTPLYMAPEQALGRTIDPRSDVYGLGAILYACLSGRPPVEGDGGQVAVLTRVAQGERIPLARVAPEVPEDLAAIVERALARDPDARYSTAGSFARDVERWLEGAATSAGAEAGARSRRKLVVVLFVLVSLSAASVPIAFVVRRSQRHQAEELALRETRLRDSASQELDRRAHAAQAALDEARTATPARRAFLHDEVLRLWDEAAKAPELKALAADVAQRSLATSSLAALAARALAGRARARVERGVSEAPAALADVARARAVLAAAGTHDGSAGARTEVELAAAQAHLVAGEDDKAEAALAGAGPDRAVLLRLARLRIARGDVEQARGALASLQDQQPLPSSGGAGADLELARVRLELALAARDAAGAREALAALATDLDGSAAFERLLGEARLQAFAGEGPDRAGPLAERLRTALELPTTPPWDRARGQAALGELAFAGVLDAGGLPDATAAGEAFRAALDACPPGGGEARAVRLLARLRLATLARRAGETETARREASAALDDARAPADRARALLEKARTDHAQGELVAASEALAKVPPGAATHATRSLERILARAQRRATRQASAAEASLGGLAPGSLWRASVLGGPEGELPGDPEAAKRTLDAAREALGVAEGASAEAFARRLRDPREWLDVERQLERADEEAKGGVAAWVQRLAQRYRAETVAPLASARERSRPFAVRALGLARIARDEDPDRAEPIALVVRALTVLGKEATTPREASDLAEKLLDLAADEDDRYHAARALRELAARPDRAAAIATEEIDEAGDGVAPRWRFLRARARIDQGDLGPAGSDLWKGLARDPGDLTLLEPYAAQIEANAKKSRESREQVRQILAAVSRIGAETAAELSAHPEDARRGLELFRMAAVLRERGEDPSHRPGPGPGGGGGRFGGRMILGALANLGSELGKVPELRAQVLWLRGLAVQRFAQQPRDVVLALLDLGEAVESEHDRAVELLRTVEGALSGAHGHDLAARLEKAHEEAYFEDADVWDVEQAADVILVAIAAVQTKKAPKLEAKDAEAALEKCRELLEASPRSTLARLVRSLVLAKLGRKLEASHQLAQALAIAPELGPALEAKNAAGFADPDVLAAANAELARPGR